MGERGVTGYLQFKISHDYIFIIFKGKTEQLYRGESCELLPHLSDPS